VARHLVAAGARVALLDVNDEKGAAAIAELGQDKARYWKTDVTDEAQVAATMKEASEFMGGLNAAVNCAGILGAGRVLGKEGPMPLKTFATTVMVNLVGSFNVAKAAADLMQHNAPGEDGERGVIVNTASVAAYEGQIGQAAYSASKGGVVGMTLPMARELARFGIRVNTIAPGIFWTPMVDGMPEAVQQSLSASIPYPSRLGRPEEFADLVAYILSNRYLNGETIRLDGAVRLAPK
jgi:NAD(P)-dependent dehydrogenase (short-subunit alcohol dehydrogenase family)